MGEPLMNYDNVVKAVNYFHEKSLSWQKITVSTVGLPDRIRQLGKDVKCKLAWSLHAPNDVLRSKLIKVNCRYPIKDVISACNDFPLCRKGPLMIEYVLLEGINDSLECAKELGVLLKQIKHIVVNLILFNPVEGVDFKRPSKETAEVFKQELIKAGFKTIIRTTKGLESNAACGMLATKKALNQ
jgi:23S rRNA (adenine2503-C2)-methyltransferase